MEKLSLEDVKNRLETFVDNIYSITDDFVINDEFLNGLSKEEFIEAFKEYRNIIVEMYKEAIKRPYDYGYSSINKKTNEEKLYDEFSSSLTYIDKIIQIHHFINKICYSSEYINEKLVVDVSKLINYINTFPKTKNPDKLISRLIDFGFEFSGLNKKISNTNTLSITHRKNNHIISVMKSYSLSKYANVGMEFDYAHFNYKLFSLARNESMQLTDLFVFNMLSDKSKDFLLNFDESMNQEGYFYGDCPTSGFCWGISQFAYSKAPEKKKDYVCRLYQRGKDLVVRLYLKNINSYSSYIENAPSYIKEAFINDFGICNMCKDNCKHRKTYIISGKEYNKCDGITFEFYNLDSDSILYYIELLKLSAKSK